MVRFQRKKQINIWRVGVKIVLLVVGLYAAGFMLNIMGSVMNGTSSPFYKGLELIGWKVETNTCNSVASVPNCLTSTGSTVNSTSLLSILGLIAVVAVIVYEFVDIRF